MAKKCRNDVELVWYSRIYDEGNILSCSENILFS